MFRKLGLILMFMVGCAGVESPPSYYPGPTSNYMQTSLTQCYQVTDQHGHIIPWVESYHQRDKFDWAIDPEWVDQDYFLKQIQQDTKGLLDSDDWSNYPVVR
jgi:hypothetical protein